MEMIGVEDEKPKGQVDQEAGDPAEIETLDDGEFGGSKGKSTGGAMCNSAREGAGAFGTFRREKEFTGIGRGIGLGTFRTG